MKILLIYSGQSKKFNDIVEIIFSTLKSKTHQIKKVKIEESTKATAFFPYDIVFVGSPVEGFWGGKFSESLNNFIKKCTGFQGKKSVVFVYPKAFGTGKAIKKIMHRLEEKGSIVMDFRSIKTKPKAKEFAEKLVKKKD